MVFGIFRISGHSMMPYLKPYDRIIVSSIPYYFSKPKIGDIIVFKYNSKTMIKRIKKLENGKITVAGDNISDSLKIELVELGDILGKVLWALF